MRFKKFFLSNYLKHAPVPLAVERTLECELLSKQIFQRPILDIGCGEGLFAYILFDEKIDVGIDPDDRELERAKAFNSYEELICCYGNSIPKENKYFNTIFSNSVLEHIQDLEPVLKEAHRLLSDQGSFYVTLPTDLFDKYSVIYQTLNIFKLKYAERFRIFFNKFWRHYNYHDRKGWQNLFEKNGFKVIEIKEYGTKKICMTNDFLAPFSIIPFFLKKKFNKWTFFPSMRMITTLPFKLFIREKKLKNAIDIKDGGLIFLHLKK